MSKVNEIAPGLWNTLKRGTLAVSDGIIALSLMRTGTRPKPGTRTAWPIGLRESLHGEQRGLCMYCRGRLQLKTSHIDHIVPVNQGGTNHKGNLQLLCPGCNLRKSDRNDAEFRRRYRKLLPQQQGRMPQQPIKQAEFRAITRATSDADTYKRFKSGQYLTAAQKVNGGAIATGIAAASVVFFPIYQVMNPSDASILLITSLVVGGVAGLGIRLRARYTGKDQED